MIPSFAHQYARIGAIVLASCLASCSETSLNEAPVTDLSAQSRAPVVTPPPMAIPAVPGETLYTVQKGDTLFHLASVAGATMQDLARWNGIDEHTPIVPGQQLRLQAPGAAVETAAGGAGMPGDAADTSTDAGADAVATPVPLAGGSGVETRSLDGIPVRAPSTPAAAAADPATPAPPAGPASPAVPTPASAATPAAPVSAAPAAPPVAGAPLPPVHAAVPPLPAATPPAAVSAGAGASAAAAGWIWPVDGPVTGNFDKTTKGIEIGAAEDAPVLAVADATVSYVGSPRDYGNLIILKHGDDLLSVYAHVKTLLVKEGQTVRRGQTIATAGKSAGVASTLHFEVRRNHVPVDPLGMLPLR